MKDIYIALYDIADRNMRAAGGEFITTKNIFITKLCNEHDNTVDIAELYNLSKDISNEEFLNITYLSILNRGIGEGDLSVWRDKYDLPTEEFRRLVLRTVSYSVEAEAVGKKIIIESPDIRPAFLWRLKARLKNFVYFNIYQYLPKSLQSLIKECRK